VVTTSYKSGTTFTQHMLYKMLVRNPAGEKSFPDLGPVRPWLEEGTGEKAEEC